ncbi:hypothetical protein HK100_002158 [Physocladia obscura]|uniref:Uncharacterized protein n=1 Tax=Physocladia obscura TaxID=109957 RepID=A0AAD5SW38_9FUNG|nr:hypothetical protein HK100_002158 [Physocladia obscura]
MQECDERISKSEKNPGRPFWNCPEHGFSHFAGPAPTTAVATATTKKRKKAGAVDPNEVVDVANEAEQNYAAAAESAAQAVAELVAENRRLRVEIEKLRANAAATTELA